jgi:hypothetical protein
MGDVPTAAPESAPASTPAPTGSNEAAIDTNPISSPSPIGTQAPERTAPEPKERTSSRREAIQAAFDRANDPKAATQKNAPRATPGPAEAKPGHNQPPEATEAEQPKLNLRKRPDDQDAPPSQPRGERGRFAPKDMTAAPAGAPQSYPSDGISNRQAAKELPATAQYRQPVTRMSQQAKADWAATPESVRADTHRMFKEFKQASDYYKADHATMNEIRHFHKMALEQGTTLQKALTNFVNMEHKLRADPIAGLDVIVNNLGLKTPDGQRLGLRDIAYYVLSQSPEQLQQLQMGNQQQATHQQLGQLHQEIAGLKQTLEQMHNQQLHTYTRSAVDQYALDKPRFDELGTVIEQELRLGFDLDTAYRRAELLHPATHAAQTRTTPAQTRPIDRSISGAPSAGGTNGAGPHPAKQVGRREALQNAFRVAGRA